MQSRLNTHSLLILLTLLTQILGFPDGSTFALPSVSIGIHHGYPVTLVLSIVPENLAGRFSKKDLTPSELSLHLSVKSKHTVDVTYGLPNNS